MMMQHHCARAIAVFLLSAFSLAAIADQPQVEAVTPKLAAADLQAGKNVFLQCAACHVAKPGAQVTVGPNLWNVVGRKIAAEPGFDYSASLGQVGGVWDFEKLNVYLYDPKLLAPAGSMPFPGVKAAGERADLIAYLRTLSDDPLPLPAAVSETSDAATAVVDDAERWQGLPAGPGREEVFYRCKACHSLMIVKQQGLSRAAWNESLEWMVEEQGMTPIDDEQTRNRILDYLSTHFGRD